MTDERSEKVKMHFLFVGVPLSCKQPLIVWLMRVEWQDGKVRFQSLADAREVAGYR